MLRKYDNDDKCELYEYIHPILPQRITEVINQSSLQETRTC